MNFVEIVENMDMSDQIQDKIDIKIGIHTGSAIGGVANPANPKYVSIIYLIIYSLPLFLTSMCFPRFSLFGETVTISRLLEQTSKKMQVHIGSTTFDLVRDRFDVDVSESIVVEGVDKKQKKLASYWVVGRKNAGAGARKGMASTKAAQ
jgi:class 3 adenylate cyclase